ncbi:MAG TPA: pyridoxal-phosphate dependent enzyme [Oscillospiraceae bacterium]|nr:pyridoxal-phosphate dependent enzyme [Oscillospiraceae bacterium]
MLIDLTINKERLDHVVERAREQNIIIPTFAQLRDPDKIPEKIKKALKNVGSWDVNPLNLFRVTWKNEPTLEGAGYGDVNIIEFPQQLSGIDARIFVMVGKWFPTGCHKVGASFGCLVPRLVTGQFDPTIHKAVWPSTGNYCRGGAFNSKLLGCESVAILPAEMSRERYEWLEHIADEVISTPGGESDVFEIFNKVWEIRRTRPECVIFNQFEEMGNVLWHYHGTGPAMEEAYEKQMKTDTSRFFGAFFTSGSGGSMSAGDYLKEHYPHLKVSVGEALQCPTILNNGFGYHRIEGIGDKHIPWVHNVRNTDMVAAIDDNHALNIFRLCNTEAGQEYLREEFGLTDKQLYDLTMLGISGFANVLGCIKMAKYYELTEDDVLGTVATDSAEMYQSRLAEMDEEEGKYSTEMAARDYNRYLFDVRTDNMEEFTYITRKRVHNLKYYTWVEQQERDVNELDAQWYDPHYWSNIHDQVEDIDRLIEEFNEKTGVLANMPD